MCIITFYSTHSIRLTMENVLKLAKEHYVIVGSRAVKFWANFYGIETPWLKPNDTDYMIGRRSRAFRQFVEEHYRYKYPGKVNKPVFENLFGTDDLFQLFGDDQGLIDLSHHFNNFLNPKELLRIYTSVDEEDRKDDHFEKEKLLHFIIEFWVVQQPRAR